MGLTCYTSRTGDLKQGGHLWLQLDELCLLDYVRFQLEAKPKPAPQTVNHRLTVLRGFYRFLYGHPIPRSRSSVQSFYKTRSTFGFGIPKTVSAGIRLKQPRRAVVPLTAEEVSRFWHSFRSYRDLSLVALMLLNGLRLRETISIQLQDLDISQAQVRVRGKGNRERLLPLSDDTLQVLQCYLKVERPLTGCPYVFVSLKGSCRGHPMTPEGLRSLFRHHRQSSHVLQANPHRFRHTFGADMIRAGVSLPGLMRLMGHSRIQTTMLYVQLSPQDVWREYHRAVQKKTQLLPKCQEQP
jgi:integrase